LSDVRPRVLFVCDHLREGGAQHQWSLLIPGLRERGFPVSLLTLADEGRYYRALREQGVETRCAAMRRRSDLAGLGRALHLPGDSVQIVVSHDVRGLAVASLIARRARAAHIAIDYRAPGFRYKPHRELLVRLFSGGVDRVVPASALQIPDLRRRRFPLERIVVIDSAVDAASLEPRRTRAATRAELGLRKDDFTALVLSVLRPEKRLEAFVDAVMLAVAEEPRIQGLIAGDGVERRRVEAAASTSGGAVRMLGFRDDAADLILASDVVCLTSKAEIHPVCVLEAMALGRPVVATDVGCMREAVEDGVTGLLVPYDAERPFASALVRLARDPGLATRLGRAGRRRQRRLFTAERMIDEYASLLESVVRT
jgi:glycosyltransferase involved in cell wall biosynthesis